MAGFSTEIGFEAQALSLRQTRNAVLLSNIANAATPNYKARDFDFSAALAVASAQSSPVAPVLGYRQPLVPALDGNTVEPSVEQGAFAENALGYEASLSFLNKRVANLMTAIRGQ